MADHRAVARPFRRFGFAGLLHTLVTIATVNTTAAPITIPITANPPATSNNPSIEPAAHTPRARGPPRPGRIIADAAETIADHHNPRGDPNTPTCPKTISVASPHDTPNTTARNT